MPRNILLALGVAAALAGSQAAAAEDRTSSAAELFARLDRNNDGFITRDEAGDTRELQGRFAELDKDNDGKISRSEMQALDDERSAAGSSKAKR